MHVKFTATPDRAAYVEETRHDLRYWTNGVIRDVEDYEADSLMFALPLNFQPVEVIPGTLREIGAAPLDKANPVAWNAREALQIVYTAGEPGDRFDRTGNRYWADGERRSIPRECSPAQAQQLAIGNPKQFTILDRSGRAMRPA